MDENKKPRIALVISHPVQHFCPQYESFAGNPSIKFKVFFASSLGYKKYFDPNFGKEISWGNIDLDGFDHEFVNGEEAIPVDKNIDAQQLDERLNEFDPDILIIYGYFQKFQRRAYRWAVKNEKNLAYISDSERRHKSPLWKSLLKYPYLKQLFSKIDFFLTVGNANEEYYQYYGVPTTKMIRMHFPIDIDSYKKAFSEKISLASATRKIYRINPGETVACVVGKLVDWKNQGDIISAMQVLEKKSFFMHLFIIGSGDMLEELRIKASHLIQSRVHFTGFVNVEELPAYYAASDIYIHPASNEPHSLAISEAISMGCPVIISDTCGSYGISDDVQEGTNGYVYPFGNIEELADRIQKIKSPTRLESFGRASKEISDKFQQRAHVDVITDLLLQYEKKNSKVSI